MHNKVSTSLNFVEREVEVLNFWKNNEIFEKSISIRKNADTFTFYDGPPTANGKPHIGHVITRIVKDIIPRYKTMKGYKVLRKAGWDTHGLPVELEVEKKLGISGKPDIVKYGVESFIAQCKESVWPYEALWRKMSDRVGYWIDMDDPYVTYDNNYIESIWWALKTIADKDLIYKGYRVVPYCPRCGTSLSSHEVAQGYKDVKDKSVYVKFKLSKSTNEYFLAWTTTPWTLPSNVGLAVNANENYVYAQYGDDVLILAEALVEKVLTEGYSILKVVKGIELEKLEYEPLFTFEVPDKKCFYVCCDDYVTLTDGTGIVHTSPAFGEDDARIAKIYDLPFLQLVNEQGNFVECVTPWAGIFVKDADPLIIKELKNNSSLFKAEEYEHSYPFCWRCDTHLLYYARNAWFIKMSSMRERLVENNNSVNWYPETIKTGRFGKFLENVIDWSLSRERYWGTPLPIWECECGNIHTVGSIEELKEMSITKLDKVELHKPFIDTVFLKCPKCSGEMKRVPEVIDCWFDSGSMPFAQWHYPFENKELFDSQFPADFISEAVDQTRGWFYTLMAISTLLFDKAPYKNVIVLGHVLDVDGVKMSKSKGNATDPSDVLDSQGADAIRWYFMSNSAPWIPSRFHEDLVKESGRKFLGTLLNTYAFYVLYANIDGFNATEYNVDWSTSTNNSNTISYKYNDLSKMDKWIISKLNTLIKFVDESLENYKLTEPSRAMGEFVDDLSNWYVRRSRERFWGSEVSLDKINAYSTLYYVLTNLIKLSAPFVPFISEEIYQNLVRKLDSSAPESVHLCDFPVYNKFLVDSELETKMDLVLSIVVCGRAARNNASIKNRQPIQKIYVDTFGQSLDSSFVEIISEELNIKEIVFLDNVNEFTTYRFKPQLKTLGPKYGKLLPKIGAALTTLNANEFYDNLNKHDVTIEIDGVSVVLSLNDVLIESTQKEGYMLESDNKVSVVLDTNLTPELIEEGFVREIVSKLQTMRKEAGFEILDRISVYHSGNDVISKIINNNLSSIKNDVLVDDVFESSLDGYIKEWNINGETVTFGVVKVIK
jgi:isoleucyl-tRNA synthetase